MGRWTQYDEDEYRLPEGMKRIGYDADTETYTYRDADGSLWEGAPGQQYGRMKRVREPSPLPSVRVARKVPVSAAPPPYSPRRKERASRSPSPSIALRERFGYRPEYFDSLANLSNSERPTTTFDDIVSSEKLEFEQSRNRSVSSPMGLLRRAMTGISNAASPKEKPERGGTRPGTLEKAKVVSMEKREGDDAEANEDEKAYRSLSRRRTGRSDRRHNVSSSNEAKKASVGRRRTVKW